MQGKNLFKEEENKSLELANLERKKEREKKNEVKKDTTDKSSIDIPMVKGGACFNCTKSVKLTYLQCSLSNQHFHEKYVTLHFNMHIPKKKKKN